MTMNKPKVELADILRRHIVDYRKQPTLASGWVQDHVRLDRQGVIDEVEESGFRYLNEPLELRQFYMLRFARD